MKIFVDAYLFGNLGDDLFMDILVERYPSVKFYTISRFYKSNNSNLEIINTNLERVNWCLAKMKNYLIKQTNLTVSIGGSMYIEDGNRINDVPSLFSSYYIIGSNFGPFTSQHFYKTFESFFSKVNDVCFRETYSYELFKHLPNVRKAPDIVFGMSTKNICITDSKKVVISVIYCQGHLAQYQDVYEKKIIELCNYFKINGYKICLMSFCKIQGDEKTIQSISTKLDYEVDKYFYHGNREEALNILANCSFVIGTRFHANILGLLFNKKILPISYSLKTNHVLEDIGYRGPIINLKRIDEFNIDQLDLISENFEVDINKLKKEAEHQFSSLDKVLN